MAGIPLKDWTVDLVAERAREEMREIAARFIEATIVARKSDAECQAYFVKLIRALPVK